MHVSLISFCIAAEYLVTISNDEDPHWSKLNRYFLL